MAPDIEQIMLVFYLFSTFTCFSCQILFVSKEGKKEEEEEKENHLLILLSRLALSVNNTRLKARD